MNIPNRIHDLELLINQEKEPNKRNYYINVLKQLQTELEQI